MAVTLTSIGGTAITTWTTNSRLLRRGAGHKRGNNFRIPYRHGEYSQTDKWFPAVDYSLEVMIKDNVETNLSGILAALKNPAGLVTVIGSNSVAGTIRTDVELLSDPRQTRNPRMFVFSLRSPAGAWEDDSASSNAGNPPSVTTTGDLPVDDFTLTFAAAGFLEHTDSNSVVSRITLESGVPASTVVDCGARTVTQGGSNRDSLLTLTQPWWMRFEPNTVQSFTSNVSVTVSWRDKWAV